MVKSDGFLIFERKNKTVEIKINFEWLKNQKLMIATPMFGGQCYAQYSRAMSETIALFNSRGLQIQFHTILNESLVTRCRTYISDEFVRSDCTHLLFIDADIGFNAQDVLVTLALMEDEKYDILGAGYPKKCISWEKIRHAVNKGFADNNPNELENFVGDFVFNPLPGTTSFSISEPAEMLELGTGFMMIKKQVFHDFAKAYPQYWFKPDHVRTDHFDGSREVMLYFQAEIDRPFLEKPYEDALKEIVAGGDAKTIAEEALKNGQEELSKHSKRYLSEDYLFCQLSRKIGKRVWLLPWIRLSHTGTYQFGGSLGHLANLGVSATADPSMLGKTKK